MHRAMGIAIHTGWAACVVVSGSLREPKVHANEIIEIVPGPERFCFHRAAEMKPGEAAESIARTRKKALEVARHALAPLLACDVRACAIVARSSALQWSLGEILSVHSRIHMAEGCFYRDVVREACTVPAYIVPASSLNPSEVGRLAPPPWSRDQKLAALAAWMHLSN